MFVAENQVVVSTDTHKIRINLEDSTISVTKHDGGIIRKHDIEELEPDY